MTPTMRAPSSIRGEAATTLGHLLARRSALRAAHRHLPRRFESLAPRAIERALDRPIVRPSAAAGDTRFVRQLAGDLDTILCERSTPIPRGLRVGGAARRRPATASGARAGPGQAEHVGYRAAHSCAAIEVQRRRPRPCLPRCWWESRRPRTKPDSRTPGSGKSARLLPRSCSMSTTPYTIPGSTQARQMIVKQVSTISTISSNPSSTMHVQRRSWHGLSPAWRHSRQCRVGEPWRSSGCARPLSKGAASSRRGHRPGIHGHRGAHRAAHRVQPDCEDSGGDR